MEKGSPNQDTSRIEQLPDDILVLILSFLPILAIVRTSILSRRWRNLWRHVTCLDFDGSTLLPVNLLKRAHAQRYASWVNKFIDVRAAIPGLPLVKEFRIWFGLDASQGHHIDRWIQYAIENQVEKLCLDFSSYRESIVHGDQYMLSQDTWYKAASGLSSLHSLKSLVLNSVNATKQFIEFVLSNCPVLEDLSLTFAGSYRELNVSRVPPLRLKRLSITLFKDFVLAILDAPYLTSLTFRSENFKPQKINVPMLKYLTLGCPGSQLRVMDSLVHFSDYFTQLERLELIMDMGPGSRLNKTLDLVNLKYLMIQVGARGCDCYSYEIINFINACPLLETFAMQMGKETHSQWSGELIRRQQIKLQGLPKDGLLRSLKVFELHDATLKTFEQDTVKYIIRSAPHLKKFRVYKKPKLFTTALSPPDLKIANDLEAKAKELCQESCSDIEITAIG